MKKAPPERVVYAAVVVLRAGKATPEQRNRVKGWLKDAAVAQSKNLLFHILEAEIEDLAGAYDKAANVYRQILQKDKDNVIALNNLAFLLALKKENLAESLTMIDRAIDLAGPQAQLLDTKAVVLLQTGQPDKAVQEMQRAIAQGGSGEFYFHLAQAMLQAGKRDEAKVALGKAREAGMRAEQVHQLELPMFQALEAELAKT
jgi:predicted Zn-dependent protease